MLVHNLEILTKYITLIDSDSFGEWIVDTEYDGTVDNAIQISYIRYTQLIQHFIKDVYEFEKTNPQLMLSHYSEILNKYNIKWSTESMSGADVTELDVQCVMALIMGVIRADRFCEGTLLAFFKEGKIQLWLKRLKELNI